VKGSDGRKMTEQGGRADRIKNLSSMLMLEVARPLRQRVESSCAKGHGLIDIWIVHRRRQIAAEKAETEESHLDCKMRFGHAQRQNRWQPVKCSPRCNGSRKQRPSQPKTAPIVPSLALSCFPASAKSPEAYALASVLAWRYWPPRLLAMMIFDQLKLNFANPLVTNNIHLSPMAFLLTYCEFSSDCLVIAS